MTLLLVVVGLALLAVPGMFGAGLQRLGPRRWARVCRALLMLGSGLAVSGLVLWGAPAVLHLVDGTGLSAFCDGAVHALPLGGVYTATAMLGVAAVVAAGLVRGARAAVRTVRDLRIDPFVGSHRRVAEFDVVVVPSAALVACSVGGPEPQIVLSDGLVDRLAPDELGAVVRHEMAHHRLRHVQYLVVASTIDRVLGWLPFVRSSTRSLRDALEHWADDASTAGSPHRTDCLRSALARIRRIDGTTPVQEAVGRRIRYLEVGRRPGADGPTSTAYLAGVAVSAMAISGLMVASVAQVLAVVGHCPA